MGPLSFELVLLLIFFTTYFQNCALIYELQQTALLGFFLPPYAGARLEPTVELHQTGTFEGRSTDWATAPRLVLLLAFDENLPGF